MLGTVDEMVDKRMFSLPSSSLDSGVDKHQSNNHVFDKYYKRNTHGAGDCAMGILMVWLVRGDLPRSGNWAKAKRWIEVIYSR